MQRDAEAERMEAIETELLAGFGIANPYVTGAEAARMSDAERKLGSRRKGLFSRLRDSPAPRDAEALLRETIEEIIEERGGRRLAPIGAQERALIAQRPQAARAARSMT